MYVRMCMNEYVHPCKRTYLIYTHRGLYTQRWVIAVSLPDLYTQSAYLCIFALVLHMSRVHVCVCMYARISSLCVNTVACSHLIWPHFAVKVTIHIHTSTHTHFHTHTMCLAPHMVTFCSEIYHTHPYKYSHTLSYTQYVSRTSHGIYIHKKALCVKSETGSLESLRQDLKDLWNL